MVVLSRVGNKIARASPSVERIWDEKVQKIQDNKKWLWKEAKIFYKSDLLSDDEEIC